MMALAIFTVGFLIVLAFFRGASIASDNEEISMRRYFEDKEKSDKIENTQETK